MLSHSRYEFVLGMRFKLEATSCLNEVSSQSHYVTDSSICSACSRANVKVMKLAHDVYESDGDTTFISSLSHYEVGYAPMFTVATAPHKGNQTPPNTN